MVQIPVISVLYDASGKMAPQGPTLCAGRNSPKLGVTETGVWVA